MSSAPNIPAPVNEPVHGYAPGSAERAALKAELARQTALQVDIRWSIGGKEIRTGKTVDIVSPHAHGRVIAKVHQASAELAAAIKAANEAQREWANWPIEHRAAVFLKAADLLAGSWRQVLNAATMLGQSKTAFQAEIDSACEIIDFLRFNVHYAEQADPRAADLLARESGTGWTTGRWRDSSTRSRRSTSRRSAPTSPPRRR